MKIIRWFTTPQASSSISKSNFINVQIDAFGVGLANAIAPFLPVLLTRAGASPFDVSLLTTIPAITGFILVLPLGRFIQNQKNIIPWFSRGRLIFIMGYAVIGILVYFIPFSFLIPSILIVWALITIPQTLVGICFTVVMNSIAGSTGRFELMSHRWSILGTVTGISVFFIGFILDRIPFPNNYTFVFVGLSIGGVISYIFSSRIEISQSSSAILKTKQSIKAQITQFIDLFQGNKPFNRFMMKRFIFTTGGSMVIPLFPLYFIRVLNVSDSWIAIINTSQTIVLVIGYLFWSQQSRSRSSKIILLWTTLFLSLYPILTSFTHYIWLIAIYAGITGIFQAGLNLVFFEELLKTVPQEFSAIYVSIAQNIEYFSMIIGPILGSLLATSFGIGFALFFGGLIRLFGFFLFLGAKQPRSIKLSPAQ